MAGTYNIPVVTYTGTDPDPVEWANGFIKPAIDDLDTGRRLWAYKANEVLTPWGYDKSPESGIIWDQAVNGTLFRIDYPCSLLWVKSFVTVASSVAGATVDWVVYKASTLALIGTFGASTVDSTGFKTVTPGTPIAIAMAGWYIVGARPRTAITSLQVRATRQQGTGQTLTSWNDFDYPIETELTWDVAGTGAAPASLTSYSRPAGGRGSVCPLIAVGVTP